MITVYEFSDVSKYQKKLFDNVMVLNTKLIPAGFGYFWNHMG
jgi:hypothetical protein